MKITVEGLKLPTLDKAIKDAERDVLELEKRAASDFVPNQPDPAHVYQRQLFLQSLYNLRALEHAMLADRRPPDEGSQDHALLKYLFNSHGVAR